MGASFPLEVWDGSSDVRPDGSVNRGPAGADWRQLVEEVKAFDKVCDGIGLSTLGVFAGSDPSKTSQLYRSGAGTNEVQNLGEISSTSGTWSLSITLPGNTAAVVTPLTFNITDNDLQTAVDLALAGKSVNGVAYVAGDVAVTGTDINSAGGLTLTFSGASVDKMNIAASTTADIDLDDMTPPAVTTPTPGVPVGVLTLSGAGTATYPNVWDGITVTRPTASADRAPDGGDWLELITRIQGLQRRVQPLGLNADGTIPTADAAGLWVNDAVVAVVGQATTDIWDGSSVTRPDGTVYRAPDWVDYKRAYLLLKEMMDQIVPLGFTALGAVPTSDPSVAGELYTSTGTLKVSAG